MKSESPIGVFDSGLGGLTVLRELMGKLPHEDFIYLGDTARIPYGAKSPETIKKYAQQNIKFLSEHGVKSIVVACNSASTVIENIKSEVPLLGVIQPGAQLAATTTRNKRIGVIGTRTTISKKTYVTEIAKIDSSIQVYQQACPLLVPLVEEGWNNDPLTNLIVYRYINPIVESGIDTLVLGCTHYPILLESIAKVTGPRVSVINSGESTAVKLEQVLKKKSQLNTKTEPGKIRLMTTDTSETYQSMAARLLSNMPYSNFEFVDL